MRTTNSIDLWRRACLGALALVALATTASFQPPLAQTAAKLDDALMMWSRRADDTPARVLIQTRPGYSQAVIGRLRAMAGRARPASTPDLVLAELSRDQLLAAARDRDVTRMSTDAPVVNYAANKAVVRQRHHDADRRADGVD